MTAALSCAIVASDGVSVCADRRLRAVRLASALTTACFCVVTACSAAVIAAVSATHELDGGLQDLAEPRGRPGAVARDETEEVGGVGLQTDEPAELAADVEEPASSVAVRLP